MSSRERLLEAAIAVIEEHGEVGLRVDEIAQVAGVAKPSLYHFYGSREGLIAAAQAERYRRCLLVGLDGVMATLDEHMSAEDFHRVIRGWTHSYTGVEGQRRRAIRLEVLGSSVSRPELQAEIDRANEAMVEQLASFIDLAITRGWVELPEGISADDLARWLNGVWDGRYLPERSDRPGAAEAWDRVAFAVIDLLLFSRALAVPR